MWLEHGPLPFIIPSETRVLEDPHFLLCLGGETKQAGVLSVTHSTLSFSIVWIWTIKGSGMQDVTWCVVHVCMQYRSVPLASISV